MVKKRRRHSSAYKFRVALEGLEGRKTISQLSGEHEIHPNLIRVSHWTKSRPSRSSWAENVMVELGVIPGMRLTRVSVLS